MTTYEMLARSNKAHLIADCIHRAGVTVASIREADGGSEEFWTFAAEGAGQKMPSAETRRLVLQYLEELEGAKA